MSHEHYKMAGEFIVRLAAELSREWQELPQTETLAVSVWSPFLPYGRKTRVFPESKKEQHDRYLDLFGTNISPNHFFREVDQLEHLEVQYTQAEAVVLQMDDHHLTLSLPCEPPQDLLSQDTIAEACIHITSTPVDKGLESDAKRSLERDRLRVRERPDRPILPSFHKWMEISNHPGKAQMDLLLDAWLARLQMTYLAGRLWGGTWATQCVKPPARLVAQLGLLVVFTRATTASEPNNLATRVSTVTQVAERVLARLNAGSLQRADATFFGESRALFRGLAQYLIGSKHEQKEVNFRVLLTAGLDSLDLPPTVIRIVHRIDPWKQYLNPYAINDHKAVKQLGSLFESNAFLLSQHDIALQCEYEVMKTRLAFVPRNIVELSEPLPPLLPSLQCRDHAVPTLAFETAPMFATVYAASNSQTVSMLLRKATTHDSDSSNPGWEVLRGSLVLAIQLAQTVMGWLWSKSVPEGLPLQKLVNLADGIVEVARRQYGCLVFLGRVIEARKDSELHLKLSSSASGTSSCPITRLGPVFDVLTAIPSVHSVDFRARFAEMAGLDGETVVAVGPSSQERKMWLEGRLASRMFVVPDAKRSKFILTGSLALDPEYGRQWEDVYSKTRGVDVELYFPDHKIVPVHLLGEADPTDMSSLGTRHRKAAAVTYNVKGVIGIACSSTGKITLWLGGVELVRLQPKRDEMLQTFPPPDPGVSARTAGAPVRNGITAPN